MTRGLYVAAVNYDHTGGPGVYELLPDTDYTKVDSSSPIPIDPWDSPNYFYHAGRPLGIIWLYAIKTQNVGSGQVEVHVIDRDHHAHDNKYRSFIRQKASAIDVVAGRNYSFLVGVFGELICIKRRNTASGFVEVSILIWDEYRDYSPEKAVTPIPITRAENFDFAVVDGNRIVGIEREGTAEQKVVLHFLSEDYGTVTRRVVTSMDLTTARGLTFRFEAFLLSGTETFFNLVGFTKGPTPSGKVNILKLPDPWTGIPDVFTTPIKNALAPNFQFVMLYAPPRI